jgi:glycogen synthase
MRILVLTNLYPPQILGGYERSIADFARLLQHQGHTVLVLTSDTPEFLAPHPSRYAEPEIERYFSLLGEWTSQGPNWLDGEGLDTIVRQNQTVLAQHLQAFCPDVCLAGNLDFLQYDTELLDQLLTAKVPVAHYLMNDKPNYDAQQTPRQRAFRLITCSDWVRENLQAAGYPTETTQTIYPGADVEAFYRAELPKRDRLHIAYASMVAPYKGADVLIEALAMLAAMDVEFTATIAGGSLQPDFVEALQQFVESEGMQTVQFVGALSRQELIELYQTHNVLVFPSRFEEPFGISQIEAMAAGLTLITSGTGGAKEIIAESGKDGLLFESENPFDLAEVLSSLVQDRERWKAIAQSGQQRALSDFSQTKATEKIEAVFLELISLQESTRQSTPINLHLGGKEAHPNWKILDIEDRPEVDFVGDAAHLSQFADGTIATIYASHILEHFHYRLNSELSNTLKEWLRVLRPGGTLMVSVPNLQALCWLYLNPRLAPQSRHHVMRMMFGGQHNEYDVHKVGFDLDTLTEYLQEAGFVDCHQVSEFGLFNDCSRLQFMEMPISLNMLARKKEDEQVF